ncbi:type 2 isopentenyl-diphosphate Delta-isomerase [Halobacteriovorax sp. HLS]|uniref:type 2 isopentenyl-diphosphate Delta-isomerase n=1 Tax=Halobacteriovorax sp. HLS TaxID=2234000 RepID=UPI000FDC30FE|nr:type 2 isopentenyl-diphosphate Delta-isomerase [Halobacteriovorax sp. HLS]
MVNIADRKFEHIVLAEKSQTDISFLNQHFDYEPLFSAHPSEVDLSLEFLGKTMKAPLWISSMTGGTGSAKIINENLAKIAGEYGLGMGLGSCRPLLDNSKDFSDFDLRKYLGEQCPFYANLGIAQLEEIIADGKVSLIRDMLTRLDADGLIIHVNPLQEWYQPEGDRFRLSPIETISTILNSQIPVVVKEVGQGMGPRSIKKLLELPIQGLELAAFGGTNFSKLEKLREKSHNLTRPEDLMFVGHSALEMVDQINLFINELNNKCLCKNIIISGGISNTLHGLWLSEKLNCSSVIGRAKGYLDHASNIADLRAFVQGQIDTLKMAKAYLVAK